MHHLSLNHINFRPFYQCTSRKMRKHVVFSVIQSMLMNIFQLLWDETYCTLLINDKDVKSFFLIFVFLLYVWPFAIGTETMWIAPTRAGAGANSDASERWAGVFIVLFAWYMMIYTSSDCVNWAFQWWENRNILAHDKQTKLQHVFNSETLCRCKIYSRWGLCEEDWPEARVYLLSCCSALTYFSKQAGNKNA